MVQIVRGVSVLEASRMAGIPHASVCGGRERCSTCRIRIDGLKEEILPPATEEVKVLRRVGESARRAARLSAPPAWRSAR